MKEAVTSERQSVVEDFTISVCKFRAAMTWESGAPCVKWEPRAPRPSEFKVIGDNYRQWYNAALKQL